MFFKLGVDQNHKRTENLKSSKPGLVQRYFVFLVVKVRHLLHHAVSGTSIVARFAKTVTTKFLAHTGPLVIS